MDLNSVITKDEKLLLKYLGMSLKQGGDIINIDPEELERITGLADRHEVSVLLGSIISSDKMTEKLRIKTARTVHKGIRLQAIGLNITALLEKEGVTAVTLKGYAAARLYPVPEFRKTTDIDLFLFSPKDAEKAEKLLCKKGFKPSKGWHANHHSVLVSEKNDKVELHTAWADEFKNKRLNNYLEKLQTESRNHCRPIDCDGAKLYAYDTAYQAFYLLIHMLGHFVGGGFGLRNLCDWVVLWDNCGDESARNAFIKIVNESGTAEFAKAVTAVCAEYLGLSEEKSPFPYGSLTEKELTDSLLRDILDAGEFGYGEPERMVGMDGNSFISYVKEFHHQMHINFPKAGRVIPFWPVLWLATLIRFLNNNKKLNRAPVSAIMKKAGKRGQLVKRLTDG